MSKVYAGFGVVALRGDKHVEWVPKHAQPLAADGSGEVDYSYDNVFPIASFTEVESLAFGQHHALLLQRCGVGDDCGSEGDIGGGATAVLAYGSGQDGQASARMRI